jgi:hypothetical protein
MGMVSFDVPFASIDAKGLGPHLLDACTLSTADLGNCESRRQAASVAVLSATGVEKVADKGRINALSAASVTPLLWRPVRHRPGLPP